MRTDFDPPQEFDDYSILQTLGRGQMGQVYLAEDALLARPVAIKFIGGAAPDLEARQQFLMEARAAARIQHPNVVSIYRVGELGDRPYIVSELIRGNVLAEIARPMPWTSALAIAIELARGLAAAHRRGVVHCDIKPANAMITDDGVAKLVDFGLARVVESGESEARHCTDDTLVGTPDYMAPEIWAGRTPSRRSDIYAFGAMLYELIGGKVPFADVPARDLHRAVRERVAPELHVRVPSVDVRLSRLIARCLEREPSLRFPSGEELREALEQLGASRVTSADAVIGNPYRGLRTFEASHRGLFFGRGLEIGEIVERLRTDSIVVVTGDSGVGKSSLVRAGVVPAVLDGALGAGRAWSSLTMVPGRRPLVALATALGDPGLAARLLADPESLPRELRKHAGERAGILLFVDQMEELVTVGDPDEVAALDAGLARISEGVPDVRLVTTVRADFLSRIAGLPRLGRELSRLLCFVSPLPPERIRDVITGPANATNVRFETEDMVADLVQATAAAGSGGLPLLSFALAELWEARDRKSGGDADPDHAGGVITQAVLATMGGVAGALARHGDAVLAGMPAVDRANARRVLLRLVTSVGTRVRRTEAELSIGEGTRVALNALVRGRLLVVHDGDDGATFELAHEVLVHGWGTLREWLAGDAEDQARRERVAVAAAEWHRLGERGDALWRGRRLVEARALDADSLTPLERQFIAASARSASRRTWLRRAAVVGVLALLIAVYFIQRAIAHGKIADAIAAELADANGDLAQARAADREQQVLAARAFAAFDSGDSATGEADWKRVLARRVDAEAAYRRAGGRVEGALGLDPSRDDVRELLGDILFERAVLADAVRATDRRDELVARLVAYDADGTRRDRWNAPGLLNVRVPVGATLTLEAGYPETPTSVTAPTAPSAPTTRMIAAGADTELAPGSYIVVARAPGRETVRAPILVERGRRIALDLTLPHAGSVPAGFAYVPAGEFLYGSASNDDTRTSFQQAVPVHRRTTGAYLIGRHEVTVGEWLRFVDAQPKKDQATLLPSISGSIAGSMLVVDRDHDDWKIAVRFVEGTYSARRGERIEYPGRTRNASHAWDRFPVTGMSVKDAERYATWLSSTGVVGARLCSELEWERAGRGADGRSFPNGEELGVTDANFDLAYGGDQMGLDEVATHPASTSPFGVSDLSGNANEWTLSERGEYVVRSGSYFHDRKTSSLMNRTPMSAVIRDVTLGFRLCASPPLPDRSTSLPDR